MEGNITEHSDSDSGDSWTILEPTPEYTEHVPQFSQDSNERLPKASETNEKDEDTDGISIISDSDHESAILHDYKDDKYITEEEMLTETNVEEKRQMIANIPETAHITRFNENVHVDKTVRAENDFLMEGNQKVKTYVHRRNKRLSTVLNIIMLGSVITAAGVAIGHMWGAKNDCSMHHTPSVNKILSNLYKLQEENAYLRSKLKELTLISSLQMQQKKVPLKQQRCKKVFEEPLSDHNANKLTKCVDDKTIVYEKVLESHLIEPSFEKEFLSDINKLKNVYKQNKSWLDEEIAKRVKFEEQHLKNIRNHPNVVNINKVQKENKTLMPESTLPEKEYLLSSHQTTESNNNNQLELDADKKISYADSLKSKQKSKNVLKREVDKKWETDYNEHFSRKRLKKTYEPNLQDVISEEEIKKDDRYNCHKCKYNKKKTEKWRKKQKRRSKHEQFDIKDLLKEYDNTNAGSQEEQNLFFDKTQAFNDNKGRHKSENLDNLKTNVKKTNENDIQKDENNWYEKRASLRKEYRNRLEQELFGEQSFNDSGWYFRRMKRREQCRAKANNGTHKKTKFNMNFKMKH